MICGTSFVDDESVWEHWAKQRWTAYHCFWTHAGKWKTFFLQKFLAEYIKDVNPDCFNYKEATRLAKRIGGWIYTLDIEQLSAPPWPAAVDVNSSTDTDKDSESGSDMKSDVTLNKYLNKHINFFPMPASTNRMLLKPIFRYLPHLTHVSMSFGYDNFSFYRNVQFSKVSDYDIMNLAHALVACPKLYSFKLTRSKITPNHLETIINLGLRKLEFLQEVEFSGLFLDDNHMIPVTSLLLMKPGMKIMNLKNNNIGAKGCIRLLHAVVLKNVKLKILDVSLNPLGDTGGLAMAALLAKKERHLKRVFMSGTDLTHVSGYNFGIVLYFNRCLKVLDLSANNFNVFAGDALMKGVEHNYSLERIDLRECGLPFTMVREIERICFQNAARVHKEEYQYPVTRPKDYWSGFNELDFEISEGQQKPNQERDDEEEDDEEEKVIQELRQIFIWATARMEPKNSFILVRDIHSMMKKSTFITGFDVVVKALMLAKQKEILQKAKIDSNQDKEMQFEGSLGIIDFPMQEYSKKAGKKQKTDFLELEALQVLKDINKCGRVDTLFKSLKSANNVDKVLMNIGKCLYEDVAQLKPIKTDLPFAKSWYQGFNTQESENGGYFENEELGEGEEEEEDEVDVGVTEQVHEMKRSLETESKAGKRFSVLPATSHIFPSLSSPSLEKNSQMFSMSSKTAGSVNEQKKSLRIRASLPEKSISRSNSFSPRRTKSGTQSTAGGEAILTAGYQEPDIKFDKWKWPKDGPPKFPRCIPYEIIKDCQEDLGNTDSEEEDDLIYWLDQWVQKQ